jgi:hypothetical protein
MLSATGGGAGFILDVPLSIWLTIIAYRYAKTPEKYLTATQEQPPLPDDALPQPE